MLENHLIKNAKVPAKQQNGFSDWNYIRSMWIQCKITALIQTQHLQLLIVAPRTMPLFEGNLLDDVNSKLLIVFEAHVRNQ